MSVALFTDRRMEGHDAGEGHPERPERLRALLDSLEASPVPGTELRAAPLATRAQLQRVHWASYLDLVQSARGEYAEFDPDTLTGPDSVQAAELAAGAAIAAVESACAGTPGFALVRPPGHHAERGRAMGFCLYNNVAVAAEHARAALGIERVLIVDWDVHHGNGTQHHFEDRPDVLFFSTHRAPFYPGSGAASEQGRGEGRGATINAPLPEGAGDGDLAASFAELLLPAAERFRPQLVLVSAGFDAHRRDPLGGFACTEEGFAHLTGVVMDIARRHADGRIALTLEGGYDLDALSASVRACLQVLCGAAPPPAAAPGRAALAMLRDHPACQR